MGNACCTGENAEGAPMVDVVIPKEVDQPPPYVEDSLQDGRNEPIPPPEPDSSPLPEPKCDPPGEILEVTLNKVPGAKVTVGADVDWGELTTLKITNIKEGLIQQWNLANTDKVVKIGDSIFQVNDAKGDAKALLKEMKSSMKLVMRLSRGAASS